MANKILEFQLFTSTISKVSSTQMAQTLLEITLSLRVFEINDTFNFHQNSRWQPKSHSQDKWIFAFNVEIQDGHQMSGKWFCEKPPVDSADTLQVRNFIEITISNSLPYKHVLHFTQKFKMATKKWRESDFCKMWPVHSADTLWVQNFCRNRSISHRFWGECSFTQKFKRIAKSGGKAIFAKKVASRICIYPVCQKISSKSLYLAVKEIEANSCFCSFSKNSKWPPFLKRVKSFEIAKSSLLSYPVGRKFRRNQSISHG